jgi:acetyl-CoA decarbonylase/synthase complex subunit gamma
MVPAITAFLAMNFTGASTFTSLSGVQREMRFAVPAEVVMGVGGLGMWVAARFLS